MTQWIIEQAGQLWEMEKIRDAARKVGDQAEIAPRKLIYEADKLGQERKDGPVILIGPPMAYTYSCRWRDWYPIGWSDFEQLACRKYYAYWGKYLVQQHYTMLPLGEVYRRRDKLYAEIGQPDNLKLPHSLFIRPDSNAKTFDGEVIAYEHFQEWQQSLENAQIDPATLCVVSRTCQILREWRVFVHNGKALTASLYRSYGEVGYQRDEPAELMQFCDNIAAEPYPGCPPLYFLDVADVQGQGLGLVEISGTTTAGWYDCDYDVIARAISSQAKADWEKLQQ
jgi:hypothetical protein